MSQALLISSFPTRTFLWTFQHFWDQDVTLSDIFNVTVFSPSKAVTKWWGDHTAPENWRATVFFQLTNPFENAKLTILRDMVLETVLKCLPTCLWPGPCLFWAGCLSRRPWRGSERRPPRFHPQSLRTSRPPGADAQLLGAHPAWNRCDPKASMCGAKRTLLLSRYWA